MQKTVKQICEEQGILGQIILERWNSAHSEINVDFIADKPFFMYIIDFGNWNDQPEPNWFWNTVFHVIREKELKPKSLAEQYIESSGLKEKVEKMQVSAEQAKEFAEKARQSFENPVIEPKSIPKGSIVTINGKEYELQGDAVLVSPIAELVQGKRYLIKYTENLCHVSGLYDKYHLMANQAEAYFVGCIFLNNCHERFVFYDGSGTYFMFANDDNYDNFSKFDFIVKQLD